MKNRRSVRLRLEQLESRWVPSAGTPWPYPTSNWSGFSVDAATGAMTDVKGTWTVPKVTVQGKTTEYAASWVGIDGDNSNSVEQIGTDSDQSGGKAVYYAWYEMYPAAPVYLDGKSGPGHGPLVQIHVGDSITGEVSFVSVSRNVSTFKLSITDNTTGQTFSTTQTIRSAARSSAEWIVEAPSGGGGSVLPLSNFGSETFTNSQATIGGTTGDIGTFLQASSSTVVYKIDIAGSYNRRTGTYTYLDSTSELNSAGDSFTVNYGSTQPPPPSNGPLIHGPAEHLSDLQGQAQNPLNLVPVAPAVSGPSTAVAVNSAATPAAVGTLNPAAVSTAITPPGVRPVFSQATGTLGQSGDAEDGTDVGETDAGADLTWLGLSPGSGMAAPLAATLLSGNATVGGVRFESGVDPFAAAWSPLESAVETPLTQAFSEDAHVEHLLGALALAAFLPILQMPAAEVEPARARRLSVRHGSPE